MCTPAASYADVSQAAALTQGLSDDERHQVFEDTATRV